MSKILLIEDKDATYLPKLVKLHSSFSNTKIDVLHDSQRAADIISKEEYQLVIIDYQMKEINSFKILNAIRDQDDEIPILFVTEQDADNISVQAFDFGKVQYPEKYDDLIVKLKDLLLHIQHNYKNDEKCNIDILNNWLKELSYFVCALFYEEGNGNFTAICNLILESLLEATHSSAGYIYLHNESINPLVNKNIDPASIMAFVEHTQNYEYRGVPVLNYVVESIKDAKETSPTESIYQLNQFTILPIKINADNFLVIVLFQKIPNNLQSCTVFKTDPQLTLLNDGYISSEVDTAFRNSIHSSNEYRKLENRFNSLLDGIPGCIFELDLDGIILTINSYFKRIFLASQRDYIGKPFFTLIKPNQVEEALYCFNKAKQYQQEINLDCFINKQDHQTLKFLFWPCFNKGRLQRIMCFANLIDEQQNLDVKNCECDLINFHDSLPCGLLGLAQNGHIVMVNKTLKKISGYEGNDLLGKSCTILGFDVALIKDFDDTDEIHEKKKYTLKTKSGIFIPISFKVLNIKDSEDKEIKYYLFIEDETEKKISEDTWRHSIEQYSGLSDSSHDAIVLLIGSDWRIATWNNRFKDLCFNSSQEIKTNHFLDIIHPLDSLSLLSIMRQVYQGDVKSKTLEARILKGNNITIPCEFTISPFSYENRILGVYVVIHDISDRKRLQDHLIYQEKMITLGRFSAGVAHEIKSPLDTLISSIDCIKLDLMDKKDENEILKKIESIRTQVLKVSTISKRLLNYSKNSSSDFISIDINLILQDVIFLFKHNKRYHNVKFEHNLDENIPKVWGDYYDLERVFYNIISNAIDAIKFNGILRIKSFLSDFKENFISIEISDDGEGISPENLPKIFEPFYTTKSMKSGTGLGLYICSEIIKKHRGTISVQSKIGTGTTFSVSLPYRVE